MFIHLLIYAGLYKSVFPEQIDYFGGIHIFYRGVYFSLTRIFQKGLQRKKKL
jgi:hypothetical protein